MYLSNLPNLLYPSLNPSSNSSFDVDEVKNFFIRASVNEDIFQNVTFYEKYKITGNDRPDNVSQKVYGTPDYDWLILITNNISDFYNEWPMNDTDFYDHLSKKYAGKDYNDTLYYVTEEVKDSSNKILLKGNLRVDSDFTFYHPEKEQYISPVIFKSYFDYEKEQNDKKRNILLMKKEYVSRSVVNQLESVFYEKTNQFVDKKLRKA